MRGDSQLCPHACQPQTIRIDVSKGKSITGMMAGRKETGKKGTTEKAAGLKSATREMQNGGATYAEAVIEGALKTEMIFMGGSILRKADNTTCASVVNNC